MSKDIKELAKYRPENEKETIKVTFGLHRTLGESKGYIKFQGIKIYTTKEKEERFKCNELYYTLEQEIKNLAEQKVPFDVLVYQVDQFLTTIESLEEICEEED